MLSRERVAVLPDLPTAHEQGSPNFDATHLERHLPAPKHAAGDRQAAQRGHPRSDAHAGGASARGRHRRIAGRRRTAARPEYLAKFVREEIEKWGKTIRAAGIAGSM